MASPLLFLANRNAGQAIPRLFWPVNCIKIGGHVELLSDPTVNCLFCGYGVKRVTSHAHAVTENYKIALIVSHLTLKSLNENLTKKRLSNINIILYIFTVSEVIVTGQ